MDRVRGPGPGSWHRILRGLGEGAPGQGDGQHPAKPLVRPRHHGHHRRRRYRHRPVVL